MNLRDILQDIYDQRGKLTPAGLVDEARPEDHPLHHRFEWNDAIAGEEYRKIQAAKLIRSVKITYAQAPDGEKKKVRGFLPIRPDLANDELGVQSTYAPSRDVMQDDFQRQLVLREFDREWRRFKSRYGHLKEFGDTIAREAGAA